MSDKDLVFREEVLAKTYHHPIDGGLIINAYDVEHIHAVKLPMSAVEYLEKKRRMCDFCLPGKKSCCENCPMSPSVTNHPCEWYDMLFPEEAVAIVKRWAQEHPERSEE